MFVLITGGVKNGKSAMGENLALTLEPGKKLYIATLSYSVEDREMVNRVAHHRERRRGKNFVTLEKKTGLNKNDVAGYGTVLIECLPNLLANEMFSLEDKKKDIRAFIAYCVEEVRQTVTNLIIITNDIFRDGKEYGEPVATYIRYLSELHRVFAKQADVVIEGVCGIPQILKGNEQWQRLGWKIPESGAKNGMKLVIGGQQGGKLNFVLHQWGFTRADVFWGNKDALGTIGEKKILYGAHFLVQRLLRDELDPLAVFNRLPDGMVVICDEVGAGIVPVDPFERKYRDMVGSVCCLLAYKAAVVIRLVCHIPVVIKDNGNGLGAKC